MEVKPEPKTSLCQQRNPVEPRKLNRLKLDLNDSTIHVCNIAVYTIKREYESEDESKRKIVELTAQKYPGIGPTSQEGIPTALRSVIYANDHIVCARLTHVRLVCRASEKRISTSGTVACTILYTEQENPVKL